MSVIRRSRVAIGECVGRQELEREARELAETSVARSLSLIHFVNIFSRADFSLGMLLSMSATIIIFMALQYATDAPDCYGALGNSTHSASRKEVNLPVWEGHLPSGNQHS